MEKRTPQEIMEELKQFDMLYKIYFCGSKQFLLPQKYSQNRRLWILYNKIAEKMQN